MQCACRCHLYSASNASSFLLRTLRGLYEVRVTDAILTRTASYTTAGHMSMVARFSRVIQTSDAHRSCLAGMCLAAIPSHLICTLGSALSWYTWTFNQRAINSSSSLLYDLHVFDVSTNPCLWLIVHYISPNVTANGLTIYHARGANPAKTQTNNSSPPCEASFSFEHLSLEILRQRKFILKGCGRLSTTAYPWNDSPTICLRCVSEKRYHRTHERKHLRKIWKQSNLHLEISTLRVLSQSMIHALHSSNWST